MTIVRIVLEWAPLMIASAIIGWQRGEILALKKHIAFRVEQERKLTLHIGRACADAAFARAHFRTLAWKFSEVMGADPDAQALLRRTLSQMEVHELQLRNAKR